MTESQPVLAQVLESAAKLQEVVPDAVLVGDAAAVYASHRDSFDHDHTLADLNDRFDLVLEAIESTDGWVTNRVIPSKLILGRLGDIEVGVRQLIRRRPLEITEITLSTGNKVRIPTLAEILRIKGYLIVKRNQTRDFLDVVALADKMGMKEAASFLAGIDEYYSDQHGKGQGVASQLVRQLGEPRPRDSRTTEELEYYRRLDPKWHDWRSVVAASKALAKQMVRVGLEGSNA